MKDSVEVGMNKTGLQMAPVLSKELLQGIKEFKMPSSRSEISPSDLKQTYIRESGPVGTVPMPGSVKGMVSTGVQKLKGQHPEVLIDKLGERLAFERSGVRLYDALITKAEVVLPNDDLDLLREFQAEEARHMQLVWAAMERIGADPTAMTPCADVAGVEAMGLMQVLNDPRTTIQQCVHAILVAELADNDGWDMLITLTRDAGLDEDAVKFEAAKAAEEKHLRHIRAWLEKLTLEDKAVPVQ